MSELSLPGSAPTRGTASLAHLARSPWVQVLLAWLVFLLLRDWDWAGVGVVFHDTDDAMRLQQVRDLLAGQGWFDLVQRRLDPALPLPSHWSRLVDAPIAALVVLARPLFGASGAEKFAMLAWPPLTFLPVLAAIRFTAVRLAGPWAAIPALALAVTCLKATWQFFPGRIDHHNVQLALTMALFAALACPGRARSAAIAGAAAACMLAVGFETLPFIVIAAGCFAWRFVREPRAAGEAGFFGLSLAAVTTGLFLLTIPASGYGVATCDALSVSMLGLAGGGGIALAGAALLAGGSTLRRCIGLVAAGLLALELFAWIEPACLRGPFGQIDPGIRAVWLDHVDEVQPITAVWAESHLRALMSIVQPLLALALSPILLLACLPRLRPAAVSLVAATAVAFAIGCLQVRTMVYANLIPVPLFAAVIAVLAERAARRGGSPAVVAAAGTVMASSTMLAMLLSAVPQLLAAGEEERLANLTDRAACYDSRIYQPIAGERPGYVLGFVESGPFILLTTRHAVLQAPYHRAAHGLIAAAAILSAEPDEAERLIRMEGLDLVALCTRSATLERLRADKPGSLAVALARGERPSWLEPLETGGAPLLAFRVLQGR